MNVILAGDIGGTKTTLAIFSTENGLEPLSKRRFSSAAFRDLESIVSAFLADTKIHPETAVLGIAGPVHNRQAVTTNLPWHVDPQHLEHSLGVSAVYLLNDLRSNWPCGSSAGGARSRHRQPGEVADGHLRTDRSRDGIGEAFLTWHRGRYLVHPSEGGHVIFSPRTPLEIDLLRYALRDSKHVSYERLCSGRGIPSFSPNLKEAGHAREPDWLREQLQRAPDPTAAILKAALDDPSSCELCRATLEMFISILAAEAGNLALKVLATGGVYLGGGIPPRILHSLIGTEQNRSRFIRAFSQKGRFTELLERIPVHVIVNDEAALLGATSCGLNRLYEEPV